MTLSLTHLCLTLRNVLYAEGILDEIQNLITKKRSFINVQ